MVRTRFAPSPTGYLHIGGVRTALFNWLFSRKHGGQFLLRIDDTDQQRNVEAALAPILHGFRWLGIDWDEGPEVGGPHAPYFQSQRSHRYQDAAQKLLAAGLAYRDFATTEEIAAERTAAEAEKRPFLYSRKWMAETDAQAKSFEAQGRQGVVRLKMPREGTLTIPDLVRGDVQFDWAREQDHVEPVCTTSPASSTISTSKSRTSFGPKNICRTRRGKSLLPKLSATRCRSTRICRMSPSREARTN